MIYINKKKVFVDANYLRAPYDDLMLCNRSGKRNDIQSLLRHALYSQQKQNHYAYACSYNSFFIPLSLLALLLLLWLFCLLVSTEYLQSSSGM